ncbi:hypothetical protein [Acinetobacter bereziniae]|uniref:hypothetical protein n=1 Tax=Acinetobacter bereziniae TaxID=106648 RepID=UPI0032121515
MIEEITRNFKDKKTFNEINEFELIQLLKFSKTQIEDACLEVINLLNARGLMPLAISNFSWLLIIQLVIKSIENANINFILNEIEHLENPQQVKSECKSAEIFKYSPWTGIKKKHFGSKSFKDYKINTLKGIMNYKDNEFKFDEESKKLENIINKFERVNKDPSIILFKTFKELLFDNHIKKADAGKLTGEWLIFHTFKNENYYLALGEHPVDQSHNNEFLAKDVKFFCKVEFPAFNYSAELFDFN